MNEQDEHTLKQMRRIPIAKGEDAKKAQIKFIMRAKADREFREAIFR